MIKKPINIIIGDRLRATRELAKLSQQELANRAYVSKQFISEIENGIKGMTAQTIIRLAKALDVTTDYLIMGKTENRSHRIDTSLFALLESLPEREYKTAISLLRCYIQNVKS